MQFAFIQYPFRFLNFRLYFLNINFFLNINLYLGYVNINIDFSVNINFNLYFPNINWHFLTKFHPKKY